MVSFLEGGGAAADVIRDHDWSGSPIGNRTDWPTVLKTSVSLILASRFPQCIIWGPSLITIPNEAFLPILGDKPAALGRPFSEVWSEVWPSLAPIVDKAFAGEATFIEDWPLTIERRGYPEQAFFTFCYSPIRDDRGEVLGMLDTVSETTEKVALHDHQKLLSDELAHRLKNMLAVVQSVATQTLRGIPEAEASSRTLSARLVALGTATDVLTGGSWRSADLRELATRALSPHGHIAERILLSGPTVTLKPS